MRIEIEEAFAREFAHGFTNGRGGHSHLCRDRRLKDSRTGREMSGQNRPTETVGDDRLGRPVPTGRNSWSEDPGHSDQL